MTDKVKSRRGGEQNGKEMVNKERDETKRGNRQGNLQGWECVRVEGGGGTMSTMKCQATGTMKEPHGWAHAGCGECGGLCWCTLAVVADAASRKAERLREIFLW